MVSTRLGIQGVARLAGWALRKYFLRQRYYLARVHDYRMYLDLRTVGVSRPLAVYGTREEDKTALLQRELKSGMVHVDLGANIGYYAVMAAKIVGSGGRVYCLEPDPRNLDLLRRNIVLNGLDDVAEVAGIAASDRMGEAIMYQARASNLNTLVAPSERRERDEAPEQAVKVETTTLDAFMATRGRHLNFLRMDIEGFEVDALRGGLGTLAASAPPCKILLETHPGMYGPTRDFGALLRELFAMGFRARGLVSAGEIRPKIFAELGYRPAEVFAADGFKRGYYKTVSGDHVVTLVTAMPKAVRYLLLCKE